MSRRNKILALIAVIIVVNVIAFFVVPPFDAIRSEADCVYPLCFINGNLELPAVADWPRRPVWWCWTWVLRTRC